MGQSENPCPELPVPSAPRAAWTAGAGAAVARLAALFGPACRTLVSLAVIGFVAARLAVPYFILTHSGNDDVNWAKRSLAAWWFPYPRVVNQGWAEEYKIRYFNQKWTSDYYRDYYYAIDHPAVARIVYGRLLHAAGVREIRTPEWDYTVDPQLNRALGHNVSYGIKAAMRTLNFTCVLVALYAAYFGLSWILGNRLLALLAVLFVAVDPTLVRDQLCVVAYIGADAMFLLLSVSTWLAWLGMRQPRLAPAVLLGILTGLATSTKLNGAFLVIGIMLYYAVYARGLHRLILPAAVCATAAAVFIALNPVYWGGWRWAAQAIKDTLELRYYIKDCQFLPGHHNFTKFETIRAAFPFLYFLFPACFVIALARRAWWFPVTAFWGGSIIVLNLCFIYTSVSRYAAPIRVAFLIVLGACGMTIVRDTWQKRLRRSARETSGCGAVERVCPGGSPRLSPSASARVEGLSKLCFAVSRANRALRRVSGELWARLAVPLQAVPLQAVPLRTVPLQAVPLQAVPPPAVPLPVLKQARRLAHAADGKGAAGEQAVRR